MLEKGSPFTTVSSGLARLRWLPLMVVFVFFGTAATPVLAQNQQATQNIQAAAQAAGIAAPVDIFTIIGRIINVALGFVGVILLGLLLYAGFLWMTSGGAEEQIKKAKGYIRNAVIGLIIIVSAFAIVNFVLSQLAGVSSGGGGILGGGPGGGVGFPSAAGSLGGGIIEYHVPPRDATGVPRNTSIIVTFKQPIKISSLVKDYNDNGTPADLTDDPNATSTVGLNTDAVKIHPTANPERTLATAQVRVHFTADRKTFVFKPVDPLGSPTVNVGYTVELVPGQSGVLLESGGPAFSGSFASGYKWSFEVSTVIDTTPPKIVSVVPAAGGRYAPNIVLQMNFNEPVDPTSATGIWKDGSGFTNIQVSGSSPQAGPKRPNGEFKISNGYTTVEFVSDLPCGINSCGRQIFCLPSDSTVTALIQAATLSSDPPQAELTNAGYDGVTDVAGNSFDGNGDGKAQGPTDDNYSWSFGTSASPNLTPPRVVSTSPAAGDRQASSNQPLDKSPQATFESVLQSSTITSDSAFIRTNEAAQFGDTFWWTPGQILLTADGRIASSTDSVAAGRISINHRLYLPATTSTTPEYDPFLLSGIQNVYQNCFNPSSSDQCKGAPNCCDEKASVGSCNFPLK